MINFKESQLIHRTATNTVSNRTIFGLLCLTFATHAAVQPAASAQCMLDTEFNRDKTIVNFAAFQNAAMTNDRIYVEGYEFNAGFEWRIATLDISDASNPVVIGTSPLQSATFFSTTDTVALGDLLIGTNAGNLVIYDMSDPDNPALIGNLNLPGAIRAVELGGNIVYALSDIRLDAISVADPFNPVSLGNFLVGNGESLGAPKHDILPIVDSGDLKLVDISDPTNMTVLGTTAFSVTAGPTIVDNAVVGTSVNTLRIIDITDPTNPIPLPDYDTAADVTIDGKFTSGRGSGFVYFAMDDAQGDGVTVAYDLSNPAAPVLLDTLDAWQSSSTNSLGFEKVGSKLLAIGLSQITLFETDSCAIPPTVDVNPTGQATDEGGANITLNTITSLGDTWRWYKDGQPLSDDATYSGATTEDLTIAADASATGVYTLVVSNGDGDSTSLPAIVGVRSGGGIGTGACCLPSGDCVITADADCTDSGGVYNGDGTDCGSVICDPLCPGDIDRSGTVDLADYGELQINFGETCF